jgi:hypothetical protein
MVPTVVVPIAKPQHTSPAVLQSAFVWQASTTSGNIRPLLLPLPPLLEPLELPLPPLLEPLEPLLLLLLPPSSGLFWAWELLLLEPHATAIAIAAQPPRVQRMMPVFIGDATS